MSQFIQILKPTGVYSFDGTGITATGSSLNVNITGGGTFTVGEVDKTAFSYGVSLFQPTGGVYQDTAPSVTAGEAAAYRITANRALHINLRDSSGNELLGQGLMAASIPVAIASNQSAIPVSQSGTWNLNNISGTISLPTGASTETTLAAVSGKLPTTLGQKAMASSLAVAIASDQSAIPVSAGSLPLPSGAATEVTLAAMSAKLPAALGQTTMAASMSVAIASNQSAVSVQPVVSSSSAVTSVASSASSVSLLASTAGRKAAYFFNDSTQVLYLKFGTTASTTSYTVQIGAGGFYEMPPIPCYTGAIDGIWASANGSVRITELT